MAAATRFLHEKRSALEHVGVSLTIALAFPASARAEATKPVGEAVTLGPSVCLHEEEVERRMVSWLGREAVDARLAIAIDDVQGGVRFVIRRGDEIVGERTLLVSESPCDELDAAVALAVASAIDVAIEADPAAVGAAPGADPAPSAEPAAEIASEKATRRPAARGPRPPEKAPTRPPASPEEPTRRSVVVAIEAAVLLGVLPEPTIAAAPGASLMLGDHAELRLSALLAASREVELLSDAGAVRGTAEVGLFAGRVDACGGDSVGAGFWVRGCGGLLVGAAPAEGLDVEAPTSTVAPFVAVAARFESAWIPRGTGLGLTLALDGFAPAQRPDLEARDDEGNVLASREFPLIGGAISLGPCFRF